MKKKTWSIIGITALALVMVFVIVVSFYTYNARVVGGDAMPMPFGIGVSIVLTGSMEPEFYAGDLIVVVKSDNYAVDDIIVFQRNQKAVTHRIVSFAGDQVITRGDANTLEDEPIDRSTIKGKVLFATPKLGYLVSYMKTKVGTAVVLAIALFLFLYPLIREKQEQRKKIEEIQKEIETLKNHRKP